MIDDLHFSVVDGQVDVGIKDCHAVRVVEPGAVFVAGRGGLPGIPLEAEDEDEPENDRSEASEEPCPPREFKSYRDTEEY